MKPCTKCHDLKPLTEFHRNRETRDGLGSWCKSCKKASQKVRSPAMICAHCGVTFRKNGRSLYCFDCLPPGDRIAYLRIQRYGVDRNMYDAMYFEQNGKCAMPNCEREATDVDHCHQTGRVRALLCTHCNMVLGKLEKVASVEFLTSYINK